MNNHINSTNNKNAPRNKKNVQVIELVENPDSFPELYASFMARFVLLIWSRG